MDSLAGEARGEVGGLKGRSGPDQGEGNEALALGAKVRGTTSKIQDELHFNAVVLKKSKLMQKNS